MLNRCLLLDVGVTSLTINGGLEGGGQLPRCACRLSAPPVVVCGTLKVLYVKTVGCKAGRRTFPLKWSVTGNSSLHWTVTRLRTFEVFVRCEMVTEKTWLPVSDMTVAGWYRSCGTSHLHVTACVLGLWLASVERVYMQWRTECAKGMHLSGISWVVLRTCLVWMTLLYMYVIDKTVNVPKDDTWHTCRSGKQTVISYCRHSGLVMFIH